MDLVPFFNTISSPFSLHSATGATAPQSHKPCPFTSRPLTMYSPLCFLLVLQVPTQWLLCHESLWMDILWVRCSLATHVCYLWVLCVEHVYISLHLPHSNWLAHALVSPNRRWILRGQDLSLILMFSPYCLSSIWHM